MRKLEGEAAVRHALETGAALYLREADGSQRPVEILELDQLLVDNPGALSCEALPALFTRTDWIRVGYTLSASAPSRARGDYNEAEWDEILMGALRTQCLLGELSEGERTTAQEALRLGFLCGAAPWPEVLH